MLARPGYSRIAWVLVVNAVVWWLPRPWNLYAGLVALLLLIFIVNFYRDPVRAVPGREGVFAVSPADGRVVQVAERGTALVISVFLSAFDVHVNRAPVSGKIVSRTYIRGRFLPAFMGRAETENERETLVFESAEAGTVRCTQVAGLLARRIENWAAEGDTLERGARYGMIHLGSRVDLELPAGWKAVVGRGARVKAGSTVLAERVHG